jgi:hypothetical protein
MQTQDGSLDIDSLDGAGSPTRLRRREQAQRERQDRVRATARKLLAEQGYDATTLRQVAEHSGMAPSTLFRYVTDKRDLIYLAFSRELKGDTASSERSRRYPESCCRKPCSLPSEFILRTSLKSEIGSSKACKP